MNPLSLYLAIVCANTGECQLSQIPGPCTAEVSVQTDASGNLYDPLIPVEPKIPEEYPYVSPDYLYDSVLIPVWPTGDGY